MRGLRLGAASLRLVQRAACAPLLPPTALPHRSPPLLRRRLLATLPPATESVFGEASLLPPAAALAEGSPAAAALPPPPPPPKTLLHTAGSALAATAALLLCGVGYVAATHDGPQTEALLDRCRAAAAGTPLEGSVASACDAASALRKKAAEHISYFADPSSPKLLPDLAPAAAAYTRTLVLDLDGVLVKSDWNRERGWRTFKRPGLDAFLKHMSQYYELVVYTEQLASYGDPILERLDPARYVSYRLYREATRYEKGAHRRDLAQLNRPLNRVIFVTTDKEAASLQPDNVLLVPAWALNPGDTTLLDLLPFLESIVRRNVGDVRDVLTSFREEMDATGRSASDVFRDRSTRLAAAQKEREAQPRRLGGSLGGFRRGGVATGGGGAPAVAATGKGG